jgi:predicted RNase H-like HicB family nuclease
MATVTPASWDPYDVWQRLLRDHPVVVLDPAGSAGKMDAETAREFWVTVSDYPDPLQDALYVIAHAQGFETALAALDRAIGRHLDARSSVDAPRPSSRSAPQEPRRSAAAL